MSVNAEIWSAFCEYRKACWRTHYMTGRSRFELEGAQVDEGEALVKLARAVGVRREVDSPSSIATFVKCPRQYLLDYGEGGRQSNFASIENVMGSAVHETIEAFYDGGVDTMGEVLDLFHARLLELSAKGRVVRPKPERTYDWARKQGEACLRNFMRMDEDMREEGCVNFQTEVELKFPVGPSVRGFADIVCELYDKVVVVDWKTGRHPYRGFGGSDVEMQMSIYGAMLMALGETRPIEMRACFLAPGMRGKDPDGRVFKRRLTPSAAEDTADYLIGKRKEIAAEKEWRANPSPLCAWCAHSYGGAEARCFEGSGYERKD